MAASAAALLRLPGLLWPPSPDEAGFMLVARNWTVQPGSLYGTYWVDRPPQLVAVFRLLDTLGGVTALPVAGALACALLVVAAAGCVRLVAGERAAAWASVAAAAVMSNSLIDVVAVKGELLGLPLVMTGCWLGLLAARRSSVPMALLAGLAAASALGMKQNMAGGLVFGGVLLVGSAISGRLPPGRVAALGGAALVGAAVPVLVTLTWAAWAGVGLRTLWYDVYGFRADAFAVIAQSDSVAPQHRALVMAAVALGSGMLLILGGFVAHVGDEWRDDGPLTAAIAALLLGDLVTLWLSGSFWLAYLFVLVPATALCAGMLARRRSKRGVAMRVVIVASVLSCLVASAAWVGVNVRGPDFSGETAVGKAVGEVAEPDDTLTVFGGRPDIQLASEMDSPYEHLWSLPMRTLDPDYLRLRGVLAGPDAPTWLVERAWFGAWGNPAGRALWQTVQRHYELVATVCDDDGRVWLRRDAARPTPPVTCGELRS